MKKLLSLALVIIMTASLMIAVGASGTDEPQNGDLLGTVDFSGSNFTDGRGSHWNKTNAQVSDNGDSVTVEYTGHSADFKVNVSYAWWQWIIRILLLGFIWY